MRILLALLVAAYAIAASSYAPASAQDMRALLVGIGDYPGNGETEQVYADLKGPPNDVRLMRQMLVELFGLRDADVMVLTDEMATKANIETAFRTHLIDYASTNQDAPVIFYFSGHGSRMTDRNGDEVDGLDETLVAYGDIRSGGDDIVDDELHRWLGELTRHTSNALMIFDSCHSGGAHRNTSNAVARRVPDRGPPSAPQTMAPGSVQQWDTGILPPSSRYTVISASLGQQLAFEGEVPTENGPKIHGYFTFLLKGQLEQYPKLTYASLRERIGAAIQNYAAQTPNVEGDEDRVFLGGYGDRQRPFIPVARVLSDGRIVIRAGSELGLRRGGLLAIFSERAEGDGSSDTQIAVASLSSVHSGVSIAKVRGTVDGEITKTSKARLISPVSGLEREPVSVEVQTDATDDPSVVPLVKAVIARLEESGLVRPAEAVERASMRLRIGCPRYAPGTEPEGCLRAAYIVGAATDDPLFGRTESLTSADDLMTVADALTDQAEDHAAQQNVRFLQNSGFSELMNVSIATELIEMEQMGPNFAIRTNAPPELVSPTDPIRVRAGNWFQFRIKNSGEKPVHVGVIGLFVSGAIEVMGPRRGYEVPSKGEVVSEEIQATEPTGIDHYQFIITTDGSTDFGLLERQGATAMRRSGLNPLEAILDGTVSRLVDRDGASNSIKEVNWSTKLIEVTVVKP